MGFSCPPWRHFCATGRPRYDVTHRPVAEKLRRRVCKTHEAAVARGSREGERFCICPLLVAGCWLPVADGGRPVAVGWLLIANCLRPLDLGLAAEVTRLGGNWRMQPARSTRQRAAGNQQMADSNRQPATGNGQRGNRQRPAAVTGTGSARVPVPPRQKESPDVFTSGLYVINPAASYSPTQLTMQYHRLREA